MPRKKPPSFSPLPKWRLQRILHHDLHPWTPSISLARKSEIGTAKGGRAYAPARHRRLKKLLESILQARRSD